MALRLGKLPRFWALAFISLFVLGLSACGDDALTGDDPGTTLNRVAVGSGDLDPGDPSFTMEIGDPVSGPAFVLAGENLRYEDGALTVDVTVTNQSGRGLPLPATFTILSLLPDSVTVRGADNGMTGAGAAFDLEFFEDDLEWNDGEATIPWTLQFDVAQGTSIGFVVRVDVAMVANGGSIGGMVFEDFDTDGMMSEGETGLADMRVELAAAGMDPMVTRTMADGSYRFDGLAAGLYTVRLPAMPFVAPTTAVELQVLLVEDENGDVASFLAADFGVLFAPIPPDRGMLEVGDFVEVTGRYSADPDRLIAYGVEREDHDGGKMEIRGPLTAEADSNGVFAIMGVALHAGLHTMDGGGDRDECKDRTAEDLMLGERIRARLSTAPTDSSAGEAYRIACWGGDKEKVHGAVESVELDETGKALSFVVLGLVVEVTPDTQYGDDDHHDGDDDDDDDDDDGDDDMR